MTAISHCIDTPNLYLSWSAAPWDSLVTGYPVLQLNQIQVRGPRADVDMHLFNLYRDDLGAGLVSARLPIDRLDLSMFLEGQGFRFIEMLYQPELGLTPGRPRDGVGARMEVRRASADDLPLIIQIAGSAFRHERFHVDPRLGGAMGDKRYTNWVHSSFDHPTQQLYVLADERGLVAFFVTEMQRDETCYWHLNAVAPRRQGKGFGRHAWLAMLDHAANAGAKRVRTSVVARNVRVLNLYAGLGFRLCAPQMTFHWVREM